MACGGRVRLVGKETGAEGEEGGALWDSQCEELFSRACAFHATTAFCLGDTRAWSQRREELGGLGAYALLPYPRHGCTWKGLTLPAAWASLAEPSLNPRLEALRTLIEEVHRPLSFKTAALGEARALCAQAVPSGGTTVSWILLGPRALADTPLFRLLLPLCDRQFGEAEAKEAERVAREQCVRGANVSAARTADGNTFVLRSSAEGTLEAQAEEDQASALVANALTLTLGEKGGVCEAGEGVSWAAAAVPTLVEMFSLFGSF